MLARVMSSHDSFYCSLIFRSEAETAAFGAKLGALLRRGDTVTLSGGLGAGKSVLARGIVRRFLPHEEVPSPTFTLVQTYGTPAFAIWHVDLYRLKTASEVRELGLDDALDGDVLLIEWPDRMGELLPRDRLDIILEGGNDADERVAKLIARGSWTPRIKDLLN